ncbi:MAG: putative nucleotidyltransferase with HDIG domain [Enterobacterales bacterium]|jgi:putative nucleotidyltransferase with HDIG domain
MSIELQELKKAIQKLPTLPASVSEVMDILNQDEVHFPLLEESIRNDPVLTARILTVANSSFYGFSGKIDSIKHACMILGFHTTRNIVMAIGVMGKFESDKVNRMDHKALWLHSLGTGITAKVLASHVGINPDQAFVSGLLHDIGKMVLDKFFPDDYSAVFDYRDKHNCLLLEAEESILGFNHAIVGSLMAKHWKLPEYIVKTIEYHHSPDAKQSTRIAQLIHLADTLSRELNIGNGGDTQIPTLNSNVMEQLALDNSLIEQLRPQILELLPASTEIIE